MYRQKYWHLHSVNESQTETDSRQLWKDEQQATNSPKFYIMSTTETLFLSRSYNRNQVEDNQKRHERKSDTMRCDKRQNVRQLITCQNSVPQCNVHRCTQSPVLQSTVIIDSCQVSSAVAIDEQQWAAGLQCYFSCEFSVSVAYTPPTRMEVK